MGLFFYVDMELSDDFLVDGFLDENEEVKKRSVFLTVLCILSYVGNGLAIIQGFAAWAMFGIFSTVTKNFGTANNRGIKEATSAFNALSLMAIGIIVGSIICVVGVIYMWKLKKKGFFFYLAGQIIPILGVFYFSLSLPSNELSASLVFTLAMSIFPIVFVILFATNLKNLK